MALVPSYRPKNLPKKRTPEPDLDTQPARIRLKSGDRIVVPIFARLKWNDTCVQVKPGETYNLEASGIWYDASIPCSADGYASPSFWFRLVERFRRCPAGNWFALTGSVGQDDGSSFVIGKFSELAASHDGILCCYANDLPFLYGNNSGCVQLTVTRVS
jgi:hypothetical protein